VKTRLVVCALALLSMGADPPLQDALSGEARAAYAQARAQYAANDFAAALAGFRRAHELSPDARLYWNMAACERKLGHGARAIGLIDRYVAGAVLTDEDRAEAARWRATLAKNVATVRIASEPAAAEVTIDDEPAGTTPVEVLVDAGERRVHFSRRGFRAITRVESAVGGSEATWSAQLERIRVRLVSP
jgi:hypothetical protein